MQFFPNLQTGHLVQRYKRFFADIRLEDGSVITAHCPNTGPMLGMVQPGQRVAFSKNSGKNRKLAYTWEMAWLDDTWVGTNTHTPNRLIREAFDSCQIDILSDYKALRSEVAVVDSRLDFYVTKCSELENSKKILRAQKIIQDNIQQQEKGIYIEVKNVHLRRGKQAVFPETVTTRGTRHLETLMHLVQQGFGAMMIHVVQRNDCQSFAVAADLDPNYAGAFKQAIAAGVHCIAYTCELSPQEIKLGKRIPVQENP